MDDDGMSTSQTQHRLSRVDRLFDTFGEQQLTLKQHDVTIQDIAERLKLMEDAHRRDSETLDELKDTKGAVASIEKLTDVVEKLQKQLGMHVREYRRHVGIEEQRLSTMEERVDVVSEDIVTVRQDVQHVHNDSNQSLVDLVEKIAQQFDTMEESLKSRDLLYEKRVQEVMESLQEVRLSQEQTIEKIQKDVIHRSQMILEEARACVEEKSKCLEDALAAVSQDGASTSACVRDTVVPGLEDVRQALVNQQSSLISLSDAMEKRLEDVSNRVQMECKSLEDSFGTKADDLLSKFADYKAYVARLRNDLRMMHDEFQGSRENLVRKVTAELDSAEENMMALREHFKKR